MKVIWRIDMHHHDHGCFSLRGKTLFGKIWRIVLMVAGGLCLAVVIAALFGYIVMHLWNWIMPDLFGLKSIGFWKAFGIVLLGKLIFGSFGHHCGHREKHRKLKALKNFKRFHACHPEISDNYDEYEEFWEEKGAKEFEEYLKNKKS